jgi:hypothetical protein
VPIGRQRQDAAVGQAREETPLSLGLQVAAEKVEMARLAGGGGFQIASAHHL